MSPCFLVSQPLDRKRSSDIGCLVYFRRGPKIPTELFGIGYYIMEIGAG